MKSFIILTLRGCGALVFLSFFASSVFAQNTETVAKPSAMLHFSLISESDLETKITALRNSGSNPDEHLYICYTLNALPRGGENPKKIDEAAYQTGLQKQAAAIEAAYRNIEGVAVCKFDFSSSQLSFFVQRSAVRKREVITDISRLLDGLGLEYNLLGTAVYAAAY